MSIRRRPRLTVLPRLTFLAAGGGVVVTAIFWGLAHVQATEREDLKEPVYRVSKSTDLARKPEAQLLGTAAAQTTGSRPIIDHSAIPPMQVAPPMLGEAAADCPCDPGTVAETAAPASEMRSPAAPSRTGPGATLAGAITEAEGILSHVRTDVDDYTCMLIKRENVNGKVLSECMRLKVRNRKLRDGKLVVPFSVYVKFLKPANVKGREILYVEGFHQNQILAKEGGKAGLFLPSMWINTDSRFAMKGQRYPITEIGVENLAIRLIERGQADIAHVDDCDVSFVGGAKVGGRPCKLLTVRRPSPKVGEAANQGMNVNLAMVFIDEELNLPIRYGAYDWPQHGSSGQGPVIEEYTYHDLRTNVGLTDADFDYKNESYNF